MRLIDADALLDRIRNPYEQAEVARWVNGQPTAQPERLTDDDFETIRIHLNAYKEKLGNLHRWEEAEEYQRVINRFMAFAATQPEESNCEYCREDGEGYVTPLEKNGHAFVRFGVDGWELSLKANGWHGRAKIKFVRCVEGD